MRARSKVASLALLIAVSVPACGGGTCPRSPTAPSETPSDITVTAISPTSGSTLGGTALTITGSNFTAPATVTIGGVAATNVQVQSPTSIMAVAGSHAPGAADVVVVAAGKSATLAGAFTYVLVTFSIGGQVTDRISGGPVGGSTIEFKGPVTRIGNDVGGSYSLDGLEPGTYEVTITGPSHVQHKTQQVPITTGSSFSFSVLAWGAARSGAIYDQRFDTWFNSVARGQVGWVQKWSAPPREIRVNRTGLTDPGLAFFFRLLQYVNNNVVPDMWNRQIGPLPVVIDTSSAPSDGQNGTIVIYFKADGAGTAYSGRHLTSPGFVDGGFVNMYRAENYNDCVLIREPDNCRGSDGRVYDRMQGILAHELFHLAFPSHPNDGISQSYYPDSLMARVAAYPSLSAQDKLATWIVYHPDTHPRNTSPDTNPEYR